MKRIHEGLGLGENEMSQTMKGLVDTTFEEGQYVGGIDALEMMRSWSTIPPPAHIQALVFLALYPPVVSILNERAAMQEDLTMSPSKMASPSKLKSKSNPLLPTPAARDAAIRLLSNYVASNAPASIMRGLPSYDSSLDNAPQRYKEAQEDYFLAEDSRCILGCHSCWELLRDGVVMPKPQTFMDIKGTKRRRVDHRDIEEELGLDPSAIVGNNAWPILQILVEIFAKDERNAGEQLTYSSLLLSQIPPARAGAGQRWDVSVVLDVVFACLEEEDFERQRMGRRLLTMLINVLASGQLDSTSVVEALTQRLQAQESELIPIVFGVCPPNATGLHFKMLLCQRLLRTGEPTSRSRAKPQARARPQPRIRGRVDDVIADHAPAAAETPAPYERRPNGVLGPLLRAEDIAELLGQAYPPSKHVLYMRAKIELLIAYAAFRRLNDGNSDQADDEWLRTPPMVDAVRNLCDSTHQVTGSRAKSKRKAGSISDGLWEPGNVKAYLSAFITVV